MKKIIFFLFVIQLVGLEAAPKSKLWDYWLKSDESSSKVISYDVYNNFLKKYSSNSKGNILLFYSRVTKQDKDGLESFLESLSNIKISEYSKDQQKAYWINLYNILTIDIILNHYPVDSILDIKTSGFFKSGPWDQDIIEIEGQVVTLNDIEHRILRPIWKDKRLHFVLNCGSIGCPNLGVTAYIPKNMENSLILAESTFINSPKAVSIEGKKVTLSSIFDWYRIDFGKSEEDVIKYLSRIKKINLDGYKISYDYDWNLNEIK